MSAEPLFERSALLNCVNAELADVREDEEFKRNMTHALAENLAELRPDLMQLENGEPCYSCVRV
eukprot:scaffold94330_cov23-Tisochrysis_lutea.AAC.2